MYGSEKVKHNRLRIMFHSHPMSFTSPESAGYHRDTSEAGCINTVHNDEDVCYVVQGKLLRANTPTELTCVHSPHVWNYSVLSNVMFYVTDVTDVILILAKLSLCPLQARDVQQMLAFIDTFYMSLCSTLLFILS